MPSGAEPKREFMWALAHPVRFRMLELLREGPSTASRLARRLDQSRGSTSYHLRFLARAGAIEEVLGKGTARERWWRRAESPLVLPSDADPEGREIGARMLAMFFARDADVRQRFVTGPVDAEWQRAAFVGNWFFELTPQEADELGRRLFEIVDDLRRRNEPPAGAEKALVSISVLPVLG